MKRDKVADALLILWAIFALVLLLAAAAYASNAKAHADCDNGSVEACKSIGRLSIGEGLTIGR